MRAVAALALLLATSGCSSLPWPERTWALHGPDFPGASYVAQHGDKVAVLGEAFWLWQPPEGTAERFDLPEGSGIWRGVNWADGWVVVRDDVREEWFSTPCDDYPGCHGDGRRYHYATTAYRLEGGRFEAYWNATAIDARPEVPGIPEDGVVQVGDTAYRLAAAALQVRDGNGNWTRLEYVPCIAGTAAGFARGGLLHVVAGERDDDGCTLVSRHLLRWQGSHWEAMVEPAPERLYRRPVIAVEGRYWLPGDPTMEVVPQGKWWDLVIECGQATASPAADGGWDLQMEKVTVPWPANLSVEWQRTEPAPNGAAITSHVAYGWRAHIGPGHGRLQAVVGEDGFRQYCTVPVTQTR